METITTTPKLFNLVKPSLDGFVFWRESENNRIEIKFIPKFKKYIHPNLIKFLTVK